MLKIAGMAFASVLLAASVSYAQAQDSAPRTVLSPEDVRTYEAMFAAEKAGRCISSNLFLLISRDT